MVSIDLPDAFFSARFISTSSTDAEFCIFAAMAEKGRTCEPAERFAECPFSLHPRLRDRSDSGSDRITEPTLASQVAGQSQHEFESVYPLISENASPFGTCTVYLSCAEMALPPKTASTAATIAISQDRILVMAHSFASLCKSKCRSFRRWQA